MSERLPKARNYKTNEALRYVPRETLNPDVPRGTVGVCLGLTQPVRQIERSLRLLSK